MIFSANFTVLLFNLASIIFGFFVILGFFLLFLARSWILYHDYRFNDSIANLCWRLEIQPTYKVDNWWISKRSIYGNPQYILIFMCITWIFFVTLYVVLYFTVGDGASTKGSDQTDRVLEWVMASSYFHIKSMSIERKDKALRFVYIVHIIHIVYSFGKYPGCRELFSGCKENTGNYRCI